MSKPSISIILPVYNPSADWAHIVIAKCAELKARYPQDVFEIIVVNDGSTNDHFRSGKVKLSKTEIMLIEYAFNKGKGQALRTGVGASTGDLFVYTDIDFPYTIESVSRVIDRLRSERTNVVIGIKDRAYYEHVPTIRRYISVLFRTMVKTLIRIPTDDTQCGLKGFDQKGKDVFMQTTIDRYLFDLEFVFLAARHKRLQIKTQEIQLRDDVYFRKMNFGILRNEFWNFLKILMKSYSH